MPLSAQSPKMRQIWQGYFAMTVAGTLAHLVGALLWWADPIQRNFSLLGMLICGVMLVFILRARHLKRPEKQFRIVDVLALGLGVMWLLVDSSQDLLSSGKLGIYSLLDFAIVSVISFNVFSHRVAALLTLLGYVLVSGIYMSTGEKDLPVILAIGVLVALVGFISLFSRQVIVEQARSEWLLHLAYQDPLTGVSSRRVAEDVLAKVLRQPTSQETALVMLDIDHFKTINDRWGHLEGDRMLQQVAQVLRVGVRAGDVVCRWGGEEFLLILFDVDAQGLVQRVEALRQQIGLADPEINLTASAGGALLSEGKDAREVLALADQRLYAAKNAGRNQTVWHSEAAPQNP